MKWTRILVGVAMLQHAAFGALALADSGRVAALTHLRITDATSFHELRAMFGGVQLGLAAFLAACLAGRWPARAGLFLVTSVFSIAVVARSASFFLDGPASTHYAGIAAFEAAFAAACLVALPRDPD